nr:MAG TPA: hypothetical protein [Caudoviricetes sp.]
MNFRNDVTNANWNYALYIYLPDEAKQYTGTFSCGISQMEFCYR